MVNIAQVSDLKKETNDDFLMFPTFYGSDENLKNRQVF